MAEPAGGDDPTTDPRRMRRIIAEDPLWNRPAVPSLVQLCFKSLLSTFQQDHEEGGRYASEPITSKLSAEFAERLIDALPVDLPLQITAGIERESYWHRKVLARKSDWGPGSVEEHGGLWKRMFFERLLRERLEQIRPEAEEEAFQGPDGILALATLAAPYVSVLDLRQLIPPDDGEPEEPEFLPPAIGEDDELEEDLDGADDEVGDNEHIDVIPVLRALTGTRELRLCYTVQAGVTKSLWPKFKWSMYGMTSADCSRLLRGIRDYVPRLTSLSLQRSLVSDNKTRMICKYLLGNKALTRLDLSHNSVGDAGARALARLLNESVLEELDIRDNKIKAAGARAIGRALRSNTTLRSLNIRLNRLDEDGGTALFKGLVGNAGLRELNVAGNNIGESAAAMICRFVDGNQVLRHLDVSCNPLGGHAGRLLLDALDGNRMLQSMDTRLTQFDKDTEFQIGNKLSDNQKKHSSGPTV